MRMNPRHPVPPWLAAARGLVLAAPAAAISHARVPSGEAPPVATYSIVGFDPETGDLGIAVQSKFFAVGAGVPWARAGVGAVADSTRRQAGIVDAKGRSASFTGRGCLAWAGGVAGPNYAAQGNILVSEETVRALAGTFEKTPGPLADRLVAALAAGQAAGGDARGMQSAALLVVRSEAGYGGFNDRYIDLRVDDADDPIAELRRLLRIQHSIGALTEAMNLNRKGDLAGAVAAAERAVRFDPGSANCAYDLACYYALAGRKAEALASLGRAVELNPRMARMAPGDSDLESLRSEPEFQRLIGAK